MYITLEYIGYMKNIESYICNGYVCLFNSNSLFTLMNQNPLMS